MQWYQHYDSVSGANKEFENSVDLFLQDHGKNCDQCNRIDQDNHISFDVNAEILTREVEEQIEISKNGKAGGFDGVPNEILKLAKMLSLDYWQIYVIMFDISYFPAAWVTGMTCSIFKSSVKNNPGNYRGISLLSCISKIFTGIVNKGLVNWTEERTFWIFSSGFSRGKRYC